MTAGADPGDDLRSALGDELHHTLPSLAQLLGAELGRLGGGPLDQLVQTIERSELAAVINTLMSGDESEVNEVRALHWWPSAAQTT